jgi:hypothetical protein
LSAWGSSAGQGLYIGVKDFGGLETNALANGNGTYTRALVRFTTGATNTAGLIYAFLPSCNGTPAYVDDFFLAQPLPSPWQSADVGAGLRGASGANGSQICVHAAGADIWGTNDSFHFVYLPLTGDGRISARVLRMDATDANAKAGVMLRESLAANARHLALNCMPRQTVEFLARTNPGGSTISSWSPALVRSAPWVRL